MTDPITLSPILRAVIAGADGDPRFSSEESNRLDAIEWQLAPSPRETYPERGVLPPPTMALARAAAPPSTPIRVPMHWQDPTYGIRRFEIPSEAFYWHDDRPTGLVGPRVRVQVEAPFERRQQMFSTDEGEVIGYHALPRVTPDNAGAFVADGAADLAQLTAFAGAHQVLSWAERSAGHAIRWGVNGQLIIRPFVNLAEDPSDLGASFDWARGYMSFSVLGQYQDGELIPLPNQDQVIYLAASRDVVAHESGHAALQVLKPGLRTVVGRGLDESYADLAHFMTALDHDDAVDHLLRETGGDLRRSSSYTRLGEQLASVLGMPTDGIRDLTDRVMPQELDELPLDEALTPNAMLLAIIPSYNKYSIAAVLSGLHYELFATLANQGLSALPLDAPPHAQRQAVREAAESVSTLVHRALLFLPEDGGAFNDWTAALIAADRLHFEGDHRQSLEALFLERGWVESRDTLPSVRGQDALPAIALNPVLIRNELRGENGRRLREFLSPENPDGIRLLDPSIDDAGHTVLRFIEEPTDPFRPNYASAVLSPDGSVLVAHPLR